VADPGSALTAVDTGGGADIDGLATRDDVDVVPTAPEDTGIRPSRRARTLRRVFLSVLAAFLVLGVAGFLGVRSRTVSARGGGYQLTVTYGEISRAGLATPFSIQVRHPGGFDGPVTVATTSDFLDLFDENGFDPQPASVTTTADDVIWTFQAPPGDVLAISFDARVAPSEQWGRSGATSVLVHGRPVVTARYRTWVMP
jgi:hypothetical protein